MPNSGKKRWAPKIVQIKSYQLQLLIDVILVFSAWFGILYLSNITTTFIRPPRQSLIITLVATAATIAMMQRKNLYARHPTLPRTVEISGVFASVGTGAAAIAVFAAFTDWSVGAWEIVWGSSILFILRTMVRGLFAMATSDIVGSNPYQKVVVVGAGVEAHDLTKLIIDHPESKLQLCGIVGNLSVAERSGLADYWIGPTTRLVEIMKQYEIKDAIVTTTGFRGERFKNITHELFEAGFDVHLTTGTSRLWEGRFDIRSLVHEPFITIGRNTTPSWQYAGKRLIDIVGSLLGMLLLSIVFVATALAIRLSSDGPITYTSQRIGRNGKTFSMYKFRSMVNDADALKASMQTNNERNGPLFKVSDDPRITKFGKIIRETSIDELPQLFNVLKGDMSLVGPRPALPNEVEDFDDELCKRNDVRPGITGLWQVEARSNAAFNAYRRLDLHYVENWNIWLDLRILLATIEQVVSTVLLLPFKAILRSRNSASDGIDLTTSADEGLLDNDTVEQIIQLPTESVPEPNKVSGV